VVNVTWGEAQAFCEWLSKKEGKTYRLPTDHEWSLAVGIGDREDANARPKDKAMKIPWVFPWGTQWPPPLGAGNYAGEEANLFGADFMVIERYRDNHPFTSPVGSYWANSLGIYDLGGNVWEWCDDQYRTDVFVPCVAGRFLELHQSRLSLVLVSLLRRSLKPERQPGVSCGGGCRRVLRGNA